MVKSINKQVPTEVLKVDKTCCFNNSLYTDALICPCNLTRDLGPAAYIIPNTNTLPPPNLTLLMMNIGEYLSVALRLTYLLRSKPNKLNFDSSLK